jgi:hypothetical protein
MPFAVLVLRIPYANPQSSPTSEHTRAWERTLLACPGLVPADYLPSASV